MKSLKKYRHLISLCAIIMLSVSLIALGMPVAPALGIVGLWQLSQFALSHRCGACFNSILTPEQVREFDRILDDLQKQNKKIGDLPEKVTSVEKLYDQLFADVRKLQRSRVFASFSVGLRGETVSEDCAKYLGAIALGVGVNRGQITGRAADFAGGLFKEAVGMEIKSALTSSDIPLPTEYSGQIVELVGMYGLARKYGTVFPLSGGLVKLPKLTTDTTFGLIAGSGTVTEKSPQADWVTFTPEKFGGLVRLPTEMDEDSVIPIGQFIARYAARNIARAEDYNFWVGTGAGSGVNGSVAGLTVSTISNSKVTQMASTKTKFSDMTLAYLRTLRSVPDAAALRNGAYYFHPTFESALAALNTGGDRPYNPNAQLMNPNSAQPFITGPTLDGFPVRWVDVMPAYSTSVNASTVFALFGDASYQYLGIRGGVRFDTSMDAGFTTDEILIRALERFTIGLMATGAVAGLETAAS